MSKVLYSSPTVPLYFQIERLVISASKALAWANLALVVVIITQVVLRKVFSNGQIALEELQWHLYATAVMFGTAYAQVTNLHVRVDLFYHKFSARKKPWSIFSVSYFWRCHSLSWLFFIPTTLPTKRGESMKAQRHHLACLIAG